MQDSLCSNPNQAEQQHFGIPNSDPGTAYTWDAQMEKERILNLGQVEEEKPLGRDGEGKGWHTGELCHGTRWGAGGLTGGIPRQQQGGDTAWALGAPTANTSCVLQESAFASRILQSAISKPRKHSVQPHTECHPRTLPGNHTYTQQEPVTAENILLNCNFIQYS